MSAYDYSLTALCREGYFFCWHCSKIVVPNPNDETKCPRCKKRTAEWQAPVNCFPQN